jgi:hypothetical protein
MLIGPEYMSHSISAQQGLPLHGLRGLAVPVLCFLLFYWRCTVMATAILQVLSLSTTSLDGILRNKAAHCL